MSAYKIVLRVTLLYHLYTSVSSSWKRSLHLLQFRKHPEREREGEGGREGGRRERGKEGWRE